MNKDNEVVFRKFEYDDIHGIMEWAYDRKTCDMLGGIWGSGKIDHDFISEYINSFIDDDLAGYNYVICRKENKRYHGQISLFSIDKQAGKAQMAIVLSPWARGYGMGKESTIKLMDYAFSTLGLQRLYLYVDAENKPAVRCYKSCGFEIEGCLKRDRFIGDRFHDTLIMAAFNQTGSGEQETYRV